MAVGTPIGRQEGILGARISNGEVVLSRGRLIVTYSDGRWTDRLSIERYGISNTADGVVLRVQVKPVVRLPRGWDAHAAMSELASNADAVHTVQIGAPEIVHAVRSKIRSEEGIRFGLCLVVAKKESLYPVAVVFGPDEMTLNVG